MEKIDLHIHSSYSDDADFSVSDIFSLAKENDMSIISISDYSSYKLSLDVINYCSNKSIEFLTGVEVDYSFNGCNLHLLG